MAEYFVGPVMEKLIEACFEYLKDQLRWQTGMKEELQKLRDIQPQIQAVVSAYSQVEIEDPALNKWYWQLRDAIDEADDVFDELEYWKREKEVSKKRKISKVRSLMKSLKRKLVIISKRALKSDPYLKRLEEAVHNLYMVSNGVSNFLRLLEGANQEQERRQLLLHENREEGSMPTNDLLGRSEEMEFVRQWLTNQDYARITDTDLYSKISVLSVVGHGGMGKTTLLQHVYKDVLLDKDGMTEEFDVKMWACVSTNFDVKTVIKNILESSKKEKPELDSLEGLQNNLQSEVTSKRFLLVLDDIWEADETKWKKVLAPLHYGSFGSKILITTRMDSVASMFEKIIKNNQKWKLEGLEKEECLRLLNTHAFAGVENPNDELRSIAAQMVEKLSGCPLAAKVIGGVLNSYVDKSYWTKVLNTNIGNTGSHQNLLLPILKLSFIYLDKSLQNCFSFCCIFKQDHEFDKDDLVRMWISLGFIQSSDVQGETLEDTGRRYFNILVQKSFFEEFITRGDKVCFKMHDLLHELARRVSKQDCFRVVYDKELSIPPETIRHLSINIHSSSLEAVLQKMKKFKNLRSLFLSIDFSRRDAEMNLISEILKASKSIRLLDISCFHLPNLPEAIDCLIHLRYLKFECKWCGSSFCSGHQLPRCIGHLYHLQFIISKKLQVLEMNNIGCQLIMDELIIKDLSLLLMEPIRSISSFRSLTIEENNELVSFPTGTEQWFLQHNSSLFGLKFRKLQSLISLPSFIERLSSLNFLYVYDVPQLKLMPNPPASLTSLNLSNLESLQCLPSSLSTFSSLKILRLRNIPLLKSLPDLPSSLTQLTLKDLQCLPSSLSTFSSLEALELINIPLLKSLPDLPSSLSYLYLKELDNLDCMPSCPPTLSRLCIIEVPRLLELPDLPVSLKHLEIYKCHPQLMELGVNFDVLQSISARRERN